MFVSENEDLASQPLAQPPVQSSDSQSLEDSEQLSVMQAGTFDDGKRQKLLQAQTTQLQAENTLQTENAQLQAQNAQLQAQHMQLQTPTELDHRSTAENHAAECHQQQGKAHTPRYHLRS